MTRAQVISNPARVWAFVNAIEPIFLQSGMKGLGWEVDGELVAGVIYDGYTGHNIWMHIAAKSGATHWLNRTALRAAFDYPFVQLQLPRVSGWVETSNARAIRFDEHLGFRREALLKGAGRKGEDVILYVMTNQECRYVKIP